jgi:hypothetical protein
MSALLQLLDCIAAASIFSSSLAFFLLLQFMIVFALSGWLAIRQTINFEIAKIYFARTGIRQVILEILRTLDLRRRIAVSIVGVIGTRAAARCVAPIRR